MTTVSILLWKPFLSKKFLRTLEKDTAHIIKLVILLIILQLQLKSKVDHDLVNNLKIGCKIELEILLLFKIRENECSFFQIVFTLDGCCPFCLDLSKQISLAILWIGPYLVAIPFCIKLLSLICSVTSSHCFSNFVAVFPSSEEMFCQCLSHHRWCSFNVQCFNIVRWMMIMEVEIINPRIMILSFDYNFLFYSHQRDQCKSFLYPEDKPVFYVDI